jgi:hypothetical protein
MTRSPYIWPDFIKTKNLGIHLTYNGRSNSQTCTYPYKPNHSHLCIAICGHIFFKARAFGKNVSTIRLKIINKWGQNYFAPELFSHLLGRLEKKFQCLDEKGQPV